jgi:Tol biopolymer transport system component
LVWKSTIRHGELTIVDVATSKVLIEPKVVAGGGAEQKWSPDSRMVAASGGVHASPRRLLYTVSVPSGHVTVIDSLDVVADHSFSWSPDSKWIAFTKPSKLDSMDEDPVAADLWIAEVETGKAWVLLETPNWLESEPQWISNSAIQVARAASEGGDLGVRQIVVVELSSTRKVPTRQE